MPCDTQLKPQQTIKQRVEEVRRAVARLDERLKNRQVKVTVSKEGAIAFDWESGERDGITDACAYRRIMASGSSLAKAAIARAEQLAGRSVDRKVLASGVHSHDGGKHWHHGH